MESLRGVEAAVTKESVTAVTRPLEPPRFLPCYQRRKLWCPMAMRPCGFTVTSALPEGFGCGHERFENGKFNSDRSSGSGCGTAGSSLCGSLSTGTSGAAFHRQRRYRGAVQKRFRERGSIRAGSIADGGPGHPVFPAHARPGAGHAQRCSGSLLGTCGTLLFESNSIPSCRHDR
jgi:hypothetical protein